MHAAKILVSLPDELSSRFYTLIPRNQRSKVIRGLIEEELNRREQALYECAVAVENDKALSKEMSDWSSTIGDGIKDDETW